MLNNSRSLHPPPIHDGTADIGRTSSVRVYYCESSGSIPFKWESSPGTPIHSLDSSTSTSTTTTSSSSAVPPLTPPPAFHYTEVSNDVRPKSKLRPNLVKFILQKLTRSVRHVSPLHSSSSFTSSFSSREGKSGYFRVGRMCGVETGHSRLTSGLHLGGDYVDTDFGEVRTASFGGGSSDGALRFEHKKKRFGGCFGI